MATDVNSGTDYENTYFVQTADITLSGEWMPIGKDADHPFKGRYNGGGYTNSGLIITTNGQYAGLFGYVKGGSYQGSEVNTHLGEVHGVVLVNPVITVTATSSEQYAGAVVGYGGDCSRVYDNTVIGGSVTFTGGSNYNTNNSYAGGLTGYYSSSLPKFSGNKVSGTTVSGGGVCGGLVGYHSSYSTQLSGNFADANVSSVEYDNYTDIHTYGYRQGALAGYCNIINSSVSSVNYYHSRNGLTAYGNKTEHHAISPVADNSWVAPLYTVTATDGLTASGTPTVSLNGTDYYAADATVTLSTDADHIISGTPTVTGAASSTMATDRKSMTVTIGTADVTVSATLLTIAGTCSSDGSVTWRMSDANSDGTPEPLVIAGSLSLTKGTDYEYSYTNNINVGTATVRATFQGDYASLGYVEKTFTIKPSTIMVNVTGSGTVTIGDKSASNGEAFGVMSEKGASVVLTLAPESGNTVRSVEYGYTNSKGTNRSGAKLPISDGTATLTVPDDLKDGTGVTLTVTFAAALVGGADEAGAVALTDAAVTDLAGGWYKVESDITFDHTLNLLGDTHLTIADGKTMTVSAATDYGIDSDYTLNVGGAGALSVTASGSYQIAVRVGSYVQTGATVTASGFIGIRCYNSFDDSNNDFTFSGGQLTVTGTSDGIWADNTITLGWTKPTDRIFASSYYGIVAVADGKKLHNGSSYLYGILGDPAAADVNGKTLRPAMTATYTTADGTAATADAILLDPGDNSLPAGNYLATGTLNYTHGITLNGPVTLILADNCHMNVGTSGEGRINGRGIDGPNPGTGGFHDLTITSQSLGSDMGALNIYTTGSNNAGIRSGALTINGGNVTADTNGDYAVALYAGHDIVTINGGTVTATTAGTDAHALFAIGDFNYNGGNVTATAPNGNAIYAAGGNYNFSWRTPADRITIGATGLYATATKTATFTRLFTDGSGNIYTGTLAATALSGFAAETTLQPCLALAMNASGIMTYAGTYALDFTGTLSDTDGAAVTPYIVSAFDGTAGTLTLSSVSTVPAQTGLLLKGTAGATFYVPLMTTAADPGQNYLHGVTDGTTVVTMTDGTNTNFILANGKYGIDWYTLSEAGSIGANKAYLSLPTADLHLSSGAARFTWVYDGETTGLTPLLSPEGDENGVSPRGGLEGVAYYTLDGRKLDGKPSKAGLYINNGKKVIIK